MDGVDAWCRSHPRRFAYAFLADDAASERTRLRVEDLRTAAVEARDALAAWARDRREPRVVMLVYPPGLDFLPAMLGAMAAKVVPVPAYPPDPSAPPSKFRAQVRALEEIAERAGATLALTTRTYDAARRCAAARLAVRDFAEARGVKRTEGIVEDVMTRPDGFVTGVKLKSGQTVEADFFIDCTGFRALLIGKTLGVGYTDWSEWLMCDRAIAVQTENVGAPKPYTLAQAQDCGWRWRIPLQHRTGNGHVFCSRYMSDDEATARLLAQVEGRPVVNPMVVPFKTGVRQKIWDRNVLSLGLASGFIEPLESTAIHLIYRGMDFFFRLMPDLDCDPKLAAEYNRRMTVDYEEIRDFIILHYALTRRDDTPFWRACRDMVLPEGLQHKLDVFRANGSLVEALDPLFRNVSWYAVMDGMGVRPRSYPPLVDRIDFTGLTAEMDRAADILNAFVKDLPSHQQFLQDNCPAPPVDLAPVAPAAVPA